MSPQAQSPSALPAPHGIVVEIDAATACAVLSDFLIS